MIIVMHYNNKQASKANVAVFVDKVQVDSGDKLDSRRSIWVLIITVHRECVELAIKYSL
jgi:hypothetical protein